MQIHTNYEYNCLRGLSNRLIKSFPMASISPQMAEGSYGHIVFCDLDLLPKEMPTAVNAFSYPRVISYEMRLESNRRFRRNSGQQLDRQTGF